MWHLIKNVCIETHTRILWSNRLFWFDLIGKSDVTLLSQTKERGPWATLLTSEHFLTINTFEQHYESEKGRLKTDVTLYLYRFEFSLPKDNLYQERWNWPSSVEDFWMSSMYLLFRYYLPLKKGVALHIKEIEFALPKDALNQVSLKLVQ